MRLRKAIGWGVARAYWLAGARARAVAVVRKSGVILPIVFHAAKADEVRRILGWLKRANCLDHCWLSFDDGWREFKDTVRVLEEFEKPATLFIAPGETMRGNVWTNGLTVPERQRLYQLDEQSRYNEIALLGDCGPRGARALPLLNFKINHHHAVCGCESQSREARARRLRCLGRCAFLNLCCEK